MASASGDRFPEHTSSCSSDSGNIKAMSGGMFRKHTASCIMLLLKYSLLATAIDGDGNDGPSASTI